MRATPTTRAWVPAAVLFASFLDIFALLPTVAPYARSLGASTIAVGVVVGAYSFTNIPANIIGGMLVDRHGRRLVIVSALLAAALAVGAYSMATSTATLIVVRLLHGVAGGMLMPAVFALASDRATTGSHGRTFGKVGAVIGLAAVIAPATAGIVRQAYGFTTVFYGVAVVLLVATVFAYLTVYDRPRQALTDDTTVPAGSLVKLLRVAALRRALIATIMLTLAAGVLAAYLPDAADALGAKASTVGTLFTVYALFAGAVMLSRISARVDLLGADAPATAGLVIIGAAFVVFAWAPQVGTLTLGAAVFGIGYGIVFPAVSAATSLATSVPMRGRAFGLFNVAFSVGLALGPVSVGAITDANARLKPFGVAAAILFLTAVGLLVAAKNNDQHTKAQR